MLKRCSPLHAAMAALLAAGTTCAEAFADDAPRSDAGWMQQLKPSAHLVELGAFAGAFFPSKRHNLHDELLPNEPFQTVAPDFGLRAAYFPFSFAGVEAEGALMPTRIESGDGALLWAARGHVVGQLPLSRIVPFVLVGAGRLGSTSETLGPDHDPALHFGVGAKAALNRLLTVRLDIRNTLSQKDRADQGDLTHHPEVLLGLSVIFGRTDAEPAPPPDRDGDGVPDARDACPDEAGEGTDGCPLPDSDGDGVPDERDECPDEPGKPPTGCPEEEVDEDPDGDGILGDADQCPDEPETFNGFQDEDGCPDEIPDDLEAVLGVAEGVDFAAGQFRLGPKARAALDRVAKVLEKYPSVRILVAAYTDSVGSRANNVALSEKRATAVREYLISKGVEATRLESRGYGPDDPIASNDTAAGRKKNRRVELRIER